MARPQGTGLEAIILMETTSDQQRHAKLQIDNFQLSICNLAHFLDALLAGDGLARAFAGAGVGAGALAADRQAAAMTQAPVTADVPQPGDVLLCLPPQRAFDDILAVEYRRQPGNFLVGQ